MKLLQSLLKIFNIRIYKVQFHARSSMLFVPSLSNFVKIVHDSIVASSIVDFSNKRARR